MIKPEVRISRTIDLGDGKIQIIFDKCLTSNEKSNLIALGVAIHLELGHDVGILHTTKNGEVMGLQGEKEYLDDILKYHKVYAS